MFQNVAAGSQMVPHVSANVTIRKKKEKAAVYDTRLSPFPPQPPNWRDHLNETLTSLQRYKLFPVKTGTLEFDKLVELMKPMTKIKFIDQIVNPTLWSRFDNMRKDMLKSKSNDLELLSKFLDEKQLLLSSHFSLNFQRDAAVAVSPYNDNIALLFHCTRSAANIENILRQGLDERVSNFGGLLGRGIYFSDDPVKAMQYDGCGGVMFIFAVLLGDCLSVDHVQNKNQFVREPEKEKLQKRNFNDVTFDSIVAQPSINKHNEYVVYNRYQCCPLYKITYEKVATLRSKSDNIYSLSRKYLPPFCWKPTNRSIAMPPMLTSSWPFDAKLIFVQMEAEQEQEVAIEKSSLPKSSISERETVIDLTDSPEKKIKTKKKDDDECCQACIDVVSRKKWKILKCSHQLCKICYDKIKTTRTTMKGLNKTFVKCPFCMRISGIEVGTCPNGEMITSILPTACAGYEKYQTICIEYNFSDPKYTLNRIAYLPNDREGRKVLRLLKIAWDRRLCFAIGIIGTIGQENVLVWNLHHKTAQRGGVQSFPDPTYLQRIKCELNAYGIK